MNNICHGDTKPHKKLKVWQASLNLIVEVYKMTRSLPVEEKFGITSQIQRAVVSMPANIAEGAARENTKEYLQFLYIARGSLSELDTHLEICLRLGYLGKGEFISINKKITEISKMLYGLIRSLNNH